MSPLEAPQRPLAPLGPRDFLDLDAIPATDLQRILVESRRRKTARTGLPKGAPDSAAQGLDAPLSGRILAMLFEKPSTRTRVSFDVGMRQLGGSTLLLNGSDLQLGRGETVSDTAQVLSGYVDAVMIRTFDPAAMHELARWFDGPVINGLTDRSHPCQIMADLMTVEERLGSVRGRRIAWSGDGNNVAASYVQAAAAFGFEFAIACPDSLEPDPAMVADARAAGAVIEIHRDPADAVAGADVVVTDTWLSLHDSDDVRATRHALLAPYQVTDALLAYSAKHSIFLHCLPAHRGEEATAEVMDGPRSAIFQAAENRLHAQKGVLLWCFGMI